MNTSVRVNILLSVLIREYILQVLPVCSINCKEQKNTAEVVTPANHNPHCIGLSIS